jgi:alpha-tubulin suppressor-like RCC1 family protein
VACWGRNDNGQLGRGSTLQRTIGEPASGLSAAWSTASGGSHTCAVLFDGGLVCWGDNSLGQLAVGDTTDRLVPTNAVDR